MKAFLSRSRSAVLLVCGVVAVSSAGLVLAYGGQRGASVRALDADGDRVVTQAEVESAASARFAAIDSNRDAQITVEEIRAYREQQRSERQAARLARVDTNHDGRIDQAEFVAARAQRLMRFDHNGDGVLDASDRRLRRQRS
ncbi:MAG: hypothetical protein LKM32_01750 [Chiayiivirga sp.]|jgi:hypothetical protein|uniref:EF-hand domain-containing protein n=1 Tax=Chiayiivirga sp. TaxID=2041042 RepID=UPI0025B84AEC|nr:EF-hand domain-containing protein [Chiayiivirga sp.]MCI1711023.1 hypothetical protein [Chiayiivirga sp.]MCI1728159.1 hypothetical protein [Chiayiivirga sp.]